MSELRNYYDLLGLPFGASEALVKQKYRELAKALHPDVNPSPEAQEKMRLLNEAYRVLTTPHLRLAYHLRLVAQAARQRAMVSSAHVQTVQIARSGAGLQLFLAVIVGFVFLTAAVYHWMHPFSFQTLNLEGLNLKAIPPYLHLPPTLQKVDFSHNNLSAVPPEVYDLPVLIALDLSHNRFSVLPTKIIQLSRLEILNLSHNNLRALPIGIGEMTSLKELDLRNNQLVMLPEELFMLPNLRRLDVRGNPLSPEAQNRLRLFQQACACEVLW
ncbi:MAG: DnaJ domain-containing protein [Bacteroidia bacterium]|nr:DnaJ domain-containing protein [Bacteroidia bacterium]MDW8058041.1 DnaJ domain-containing protein [Bacteroidia bacterium]